MLPKSQRLTSRQVREVLKEGRPVRAGGVSAVFMSASRGAAAMVASSKVAKRAVDRNRLRRLGYAALPKPLPKARVVFFIRTKDSDPADIAKNIAQICSKLSS